MTSKILKATEERTESTYLAYTNASPEVANFDEAFQGLQLRKRHRKQSPSSQQSFMISMLSTYREQGNVSVE